VRVLSLKGGGTITEQLTGYSDKGHSMNYRIEESPLPITDYRSTIAVKPSGAGKSTLVWSSTFMAKPSTPDAEAKTLMEGIYDAGLDNVGSNSAAASSTRGSSSEHRALDRQAAAQERRPAAPPSMQASGLSSSGVERGEVARRRGRPCFASAQQSSNDATSMLAVIGLATASRSALRQAASSRHDARSAGCSRVPGARRLHMPEFNARCRPAIIGSTRMRGSPGRPSLALPG
jgi:hypothetical protein